MFQALNFFFLLFDQNILNSFNTTHNNLEYKAGLNLTKISNADDDLKDAFLNV